MKHEHLPALNRYTSPTQYEALVEIEKTKSLVGLLMKGSMSKTVGSLIRSAWVQAHTHTDEDGVLKESWIVTDAGQHAMSLYNVKKEEEKKEKERLDAVKKTLFDASVTYYKLQRVIEKYKRSKDDLEVKIANLKDHCYKHEREANAIASKLHMFDARRVFEAALKAVNEEDEGESK
jgi:hypothetical protein